jgi:hypothetical protein
LADAAATVLTAVVDDPTGYGRVVRGKDGRVRAIVEETDANAEEKTIDEVNTSIYCFRRSLLAPALRRLSPENAQGEYYLSDVVGVLHDAGYPVISVVSDDASETAGVNDRKQLAIAEAALRARTNDRWLQLGVTMLDPARTYIDTDVTIAPDVMGIRSWVVARGSGPTFGSPTASSASTRWSSRPSRRMPRSARAPSWDRSRCCGPAAMCPTVPGRGRSTLPTGSTTESFHVVRGVAGWS